MALGRNSVMKKLNILIALMVVLSLFVAPAYTVDAAKKWTYYSKEKKADVKKTSLFDVKTNSVNINVKGFKDKEDIVLNIYEKQDNGKYKKIKTKKKKDIKGDVFKFKQTLNEKSDFDYGKTYKYKITSKECYVEKKNLSEYLNTDNTIGLGNSIFEKKNQKVLSDGDKVNFKNSGKILEFKHKKNKQTKSFKTITKKKRLLEFSKKYKKYTYSQAKRHQKGFADCSSFVYACYKDIGMNMGGEGANTETELRWCEQNALKVKLGSAKLGDIIFYSDEDVDTFEEHYKHVTHVAMFKSNNKIMEMTGDGIDFRTRDVSARDHDCIAVYRPIYDSKDYADKDYHKQNIKKSKKEKKDKKLLKKQKEENKKKKNKAKKSKTKKTPAKKQEEETVELIQREDETVEVE